MIENMTELTQAENMAYFKADLCLYSPESYTLEEKRGICNEMIATSGAILDTMRADFEQLPPRPTASSSRCFASPTSSRPAGDGKCWWVKKTRYIGV